MNIEFELKRVYEEFNYLNTQKTIFYRVIISYMYEELKKREFLYINDVFSYMKEFEEFSDYTEEECYKDLEVLTNWGNVIKYKNDYSMIKSIDEIKKKKHRYQLSEKTRKIENLVKNEFNEINNLSSVLDKNLLRNFRMELEKVFESDFVEREKKELYFWWMNIVNAYVLMNKNYINFIQDLNYIDFDKITKVDEFLINKNRIKEYLEEFIIGLVEESEALEMILNRLDKLPNLNLLFEKIIEEEQNVLQMRSMEELKVGIAKDRVMEQKNKIYSWFVGEEGYEKEVEVLRKNSINVIGKILKIAKKLILKNSINFSRRENYKNIAKLFSEMEITEAYKFSAYLFGVQNSYHLKGNKEGINREEILSVDEEEQLEIILSKLKERETSKKRIAFTDKTIEKANYRMKIEEERKTKRDELDKYVVNKKLSLENLPKISSFMKNLLIDYIKKGLSKPNANKIILENNKLYKEYDLVELNNMKYKLLVPQDKESRTIVHVEDGDLDIPSFILRFEEKND